MKKYIGKDITGRKIYFAPSDKASKNYDEIIDFIHKIFNIDAEDLVFISDDSSLSDFLGQEDDMETIEDVVKKVKRIYEKDISKIRDEPIVEVVRFVKK